MGHRWLLLAFSAQAIACLGLRCSLVIRCEAIIDLNMKRVPVLQSSRVTLRPPQDGDRAERLAIGEHAEYVRMVGGDPRNLKPLTKADVDRWYDDISLHTYCWVIEADHHCIGEARLDHLDTHNRRARYAIGIFDPANWGHGYGTETTRLVLDYAFQEIRLHRVDLRVLAINHLAIACYEGCGFQREGVEREGARIADEWHTDVFMSILEQEYRAMVPYPEDP